MTIRCLGIDLGWSSGASGVCCLESGENYFILKDLQCLPTSQDVFAWVEHWSLNQDRVVIAVDAPLIIGNKTGMRVADKLTHHYFGKYHAGCYPASQQRPYAESVTSFSLTLAKLGFKHEPRQVDKSIGRFQIEVFPHPATINLFGLEKILKYKKGKLAQRQEELGKLRDYILEFLPKLTPSLVLTSESLPSIPTTAKALKVVEDKLDSVICAYIAAYWWWQDLSKIMILGDVEEGYIVIPN